MKKFIPIILIVIVIFLSSCGTSSEKVFNLPSNATDIQQVGNGWATFYLGDKRFLFYRGHSGHTGYQCITQIK